VTAVKNVRIEVKNQSAVVDRLDANVAILDRAVTAKDSPGDNARSQSSDNERGRYDHRYKLSVPVEVTKLDYYGRELEVWAQAQDANKLQATARDMRRTWDSLRPSIETPSAAEAKKFDALVARVRIS